jgi:hypothetical protein
MWLYICSGMINPKQEAAGNHSTLKEYVGRYPFVANAATRERRDKICTKRDTVAHSLTADPVWWWAGVRQRAGRVQNHFGSGGGGWCAGVVVDVLGWSRRLQPSKRLYLHV